MAIIIDALHQVNFERWILIFVFLKSFLCPTEAIFSDQLSDSPQILFYHKNLY